MTGSNIPALLEKAKALPLSPGVYLMKNKDGKVIYVGKSRALKNRVSSYFSDLSGHTVKTSRLVENIVDFDVMLTNTEMEALTLENRLIKLYSPKFNIKLKDSKNYPYIKITNEEFPRLEVVRKRLNDGGKYFGPYSGTGTAYGIIGTVRKLFRVPDCKKRFPKDFGTRPCLNKQIGICDGLCSGEITAEEYRKRFRLIQSFLGGNLTGIRRQLTEEMEYAAENLMFENAAVIRDRIKHLDNLSSKQKIVGAPGTETDIISFFSEGSGTCIAVFYVRDGAVIDNDRYIFDCPSLESDDCISFLFNHYTLREYIPQEILCDLPLSPEDTEIFAELLTEKAGRKTDIHKPVKGKPKALCGMVAENAGEYLRQNNAKIEKDNRTLVHLASLLSLEVLPERIEAFDISNLGNENIVAGKISVENGKFNKKAYRSFKIRSTEIQDDYASMSEAVTRRFQHTEDPFPDLLLIDGGKGHVETVKKALIPLNVTIPVFGMVKDEFHKTRTLTDGESEISISTERDVFILIYGIQEEVHRFTVSKMTSAKRKTLKRSSLEAISGIGPKKSSALLKTFGGLRGIKEATFEMLVNTPGISETDALNIIKYFEEK